MERMVAYVFGNLQKSENDIKSIKKCLKSQIKLNKYLALMALLGSICIINNELNIKRLERDIKELKKTKGE